MRSFIKTFEQFVAEEAINAGPESEVVIDDMITHNGTEISSEEILGIVISSETEEEVKDKMYDKFGQTTFAEADISKVVGYWNAYQAEIKEKEKEEEKKKEGGEGGDTADLMADL